MKIFGTVDSFVELADKSLKLGRLVANLEFLTALLEYGSFDAYHLFCPTRANLELCRKTLGRTLADPKLLERVVFYLHVQVPGELARTGYSAFHVGDWSRYLPRLAFLRANHSRRPFPLSGCIHSLNGPDVVPKFRQLTRSCLLGYDAVVCTSACGREVFRRYLAAVAPEGSFLPRLVQIPLGVSEAFFAPRERRKCRERLRLPRGGVHLLYLGRISAYSKADLAPLLYLFADLLRRKEGERDVYLILAGASDAANLRNLEEVVSELGLKSRVVFKPNVEDEQKLDLYGAADVFVSPVDNHQETFGLSIVEAMASGLPVVASDFDGYRELVVDGETGYTVPTYWARPPHAVTELRGILEPNIAQFALSQSVALDMQAFRRSLTLLIDQPEKRLAMGQAGRARAQAEYAWQKVIGQYEELWSELAEEATRASSPSPMADPDIVDPFDLFSAYPTEIFREDHRLELTTLGREILLGRVPMPAMYQDLAPLLAAALLPFLLGALAKESLTVGELGSRAKKDKDVAEEQTRYTILWLCKYGLVERVRV